MTRRDLVTRISSPVTDGGGDESAPAGEAEGVRASSGRPAYHKPLTPALVAKSRARSLRREMSPPERRLWNYIKGNQLAGLRFRRQHPIGPFIADFYCHAAALVIEIDGSTHQAEQKDHDDRRDMWMKTRDIGVLRIRAIDVRDNLQGVLSTIERTASDRIRSRQTRGAPSDPAHPPDEPGHLPRR